MPRKKSKKQKIRENFKVVVRCRPLNQKEKRWNPKHGVIVDEISGTITINKLETDEKPPKTFTFDSVFGADSKQLEFYNLTARPIIDSVLKGYNGTIIAYGQTGSGKTFTMEGVKDRPELRGIILNSFAHIFGHIAKAGSDNRFSVRASYLEIYNEEVRDLLRNDPMKKPKVYEMADDFVDIKDLTHHDVKNYDEIERIMQLGQKKRSVGATNMNKHSSRSHAIFSVIIESSKKSADGNWHVRVGKLNLVDLAGSERLAKSGSTGQRSEEAKKINLSLFTLSRVIRALVDGESKYVPYRNSKLTRLLRDSLGGNSKALMCANISPADSNYNETMNTLWFAHKAKKIKNTALMNKDPKDAVLCQHQKIIDSLKKKTEEHEISASDNSESGANVEQGGSRRRRRGRKTVSPDTMAEMKAKIEEERKTMKAKLDMEEKEKKKARAELKKREEDLLQAQQESHLLREKLSVLEKRVIVGGTDLSGKLEEQEKLLQDSKNKLEKRRKREQQLRGILEKKQQECLDMPKETEDKSEKLRKVSTKLEKVKSVIKQKNEILLQEITQLRKEQQLQRLIFDTFFSKENQELIMSNAHWNEDAGEWRLNFDAYDANNMRKQTPAPKEQSDAFDLPPIYPLIHYEERKQKLLLKPKRRPKPGRSLQCL